MSHAPPLLGLPQVPLLGQNLLPSLLWMSQCRAWAQWVLPWTQYVTWRAWKARTPLCSPSLGLKSSQPLARPQSPQSDMARAGLVLLGTSQGWRGGRGGIAAPALSSSAPKEAFFFPLLGVTQASKHQPPRFRQATGPCLTLPHGQGQFGDSFGCGTAKPTQLVPRRRPMRSFPLLSHGRGFQPQPPSGKHACP